MKSFAEHILLTGALFFSLLSCQGHIDDGNGEGTGCLYLSADRTAIAADGREKITFTVKYADEDVSGSDRMQIGIAETGGEAVSWLAPGKNIFSASVAGRYSVSAVYTDADRNVYRSDEIEITLSDAGMVPQAFTRKMLFTQFTSVGCGNCPAMTESIASVQEERPGLLVPVSLHIPYDPKFPDPMAIQMCSSIAKRFGVTGLPHGFVNYSQELSTTSDISTITDALDKALAETVQPCGIAVTTAWDKASDIVTVDLKVTPSEHGYYRYLVFLIEDGISYYQVDYSPDAAEGTDYIHNRVVRRVMSSNIRGEKLNEGLAPIPWVEIAASRSSSLDTEWNTDNMKAVVAVLYAENSGDEYYCLNTVECALDGSTEYQIVE